MMNNKQRSKTTGEIEHVKCEEDDEEKKSKSLLDLVVENNENAKVWQIVLTSIIEANKNLEKKIEIPDLEKSTLEDIIEKHGKEKHVLELEQFIFSQSSDHKTSLVKVSGGSVPTDSRDEKRNFFLERSIKFERKVDKTLNMKITSHTHTLFYLLREKDGINYKSLYESLDLEKNFELRVNDSKSLLGRSSASFFFSHDDKLVLKSIDLNNYESFSDILPNYFNFLLREKSSLQSRIYGVYKIEEDVLTKRYFVLMENVFEQINMHIPLRIYDLKGSTHDRTAKEFKFNIDEQKKKLNELFIEFKAPLSSLDPKELRAHLSPVGGRDLDFYESDDYLIKVLKEDKDLLMKSIEKDTEFFSRNNLMDYSVIYGIALKCDAVKTPSIDKSNYKFWRCYDSLDGRYVYSISIVDFFQNYNFKKKFENTFKCIINTDIAGDLSCSEPEFYKDRFRKFFYINIACDVSSKKI